MSDRLFDPAPPPPPLATLERWPPRAMFHMLVSSWRAGDNLLHMFHPEAESRPYVVNALGTLRLVTVNDAAFARHILSDHAERYVKSHMYEAMLGDFLGPTSSLVTEGDMARFKRRLLAPAFNARSLRRLEGVVDAHVRRTLDRWAALGPGAEIDLTLEAPKLAMEIAMEAFFSATLGDRADAIAALLDEVMLEAGSPSMADVMDLPGWVPRRSRAGLRAKIARLDAALYAVIDERLARRGDGPPETPDMLDVLVHAADPETGAPLSRREVRNEVVTLFMAGHETTALSLAWGLDRLAREPAAQSALAETATAAEAAAGRPLTPAEARGTPLVAETYDEMLRLYPPAFVVARTAVAPDRFGDLEIRPNDRFQIAIFLLHRNRRYWDAPGAFRPERFAGAGKPAAFMPFGAGPRTCIGMGMARMEGQALLANLAPRFGLEPVGPPPEPVGKITLRSREHIRLRLRPKASPSPRTGARTAAETV